MHYPNQPSQSKTHSVEYQVEEEYDPGTEHVAAAALGKISGQISGSEYDVRSTNSVVGNNFAGYSAKNFEDFASAQLIMLERAKEQLRVLANQMDGLRATKWVTHTKTINDGNSHPGNTR
jgi:hypothetical protein